MFLIFFVYFSFPRFVWRGATPVLSRRSHPARPGRGPSTWMRWCAGSRTGRSRSCSCAPSALARCPGVQPPLLLRTRKRPAQLSHKHSLWRLAVWIPLTPPFWMSISFSLKLVWKLPIAVISEVSLGFSRKAIPIKFGISY